jgi:heme-degrading monooxygenase HmoA
MKSAHPTPYYAVIFSSTRSAQDEAGYEKMAVRMVELAKVQKGFLGVESARSPDGLGVTISYWSSLEDITDWKKHSEHQLAQELGRSQWYESYTTRICKVEREYGFGSRGEQR